MSTLNIVLTVVGVLWVLGIAAMVYAFMTAEENNDPDEWEGK